MNRGLSSRYRYHITCAISSIETSFNMSLEDSLANVSLYDAKKYFRRAQNVVFNYTDMEAKVREATNNEPWGASTTLMEQISQGTYNLREREEVLGMIFRRFTEKRANEWRQIYKALQLLDYLIRHGSERFIDDTRGSISLIKMLESFHYIDSQGRDQGINVRNRAKALAELLGDDEKIRSERKKARETAKKYKGVAGGSAAGTAGLNSRAGFSSSKVHGISVSAESDDDADDGEGISASPFKDFSSREESVSNPGVVPSSHDSTASRTNNVEEGDDDDDDDDEFAEFQSAVPSAQTPSVDSSSQTKDDHIYTIKPIAAATFPDIVPAIATETKKADPFSSLFSNAKNSSEIKQHIKPSNTFGSEKTATEHTDINENATPLDEDDDDDDMFGEMTGAGASQQQGKDSAVPAGEIDLLSF